ncbi:hypothetical protein NLU13_9161 [Sarocladium strictum]|uniref:Phytocyanin domain-containing protein n=1 Tax=Sarocladium strictum TaxID=5046 RepID=A0AA39GAQ8_SARSR|nr:hypothetical protein NLU13_9161 [Sarocladium strictum]
MQYSLLNLAALALTASQVSAEVHKVQVGQDGLTFSPNNIKASKGDLVEFHFDGDHSVVASDFDAPCTPAKSGGFGSGPLPDGDKTWFSINITSTDPIWFYCGVPGHCQAGMVGVINEGTAHNLSDYASAAAKTEKTTNPPQPFGGIISQKAISEGSSAEASGTSGSSATATHSGSAAATTTSAKGDAGRLHGSMIGVFGLSLVLAGALSA